MCFSIQEVAALSKGKACGISVVTVLVLVDPETCEEMASRVWVNMYSPGKELTHLDLPQEVDAAAKEAATKILRMTDSYVSVGEV